MENGGAKVEQCNNKTNKLDKIHRNEFHNASIITRFIHVKFVRNSYEFHVNFVQFADKESKHKSKHALQSHGHVFDHATAFEHRGNRHAGAVLTRSHSVVGRPGGATPDMALDLRLCIDVIPLANLDLVHAPNEEEHALLADRRRGPREHPPPTTPPSQPPPSAPTTRGPRRGSPC